MPLKHFVHRLADEQLAGFAPALASLIFDSLCPPRRTANAPSARWRTNAHSLGR
jgi:hypothetical protein